MKQEQICVSLELAKELKKNNYPQESLFYWVEFADGKDNIIIQDPRTMENFDHCEFEIISAPTASELLERLPGIVCSNKYGDGTLFIEKYTNHERDSYEITYRSLRDKKVTIQGRKGNLIPTQTLPNALAKMWIYLKENNLLN